MQKSALHIFSGVRRYGDIQHDLTIFPAVFAFAARHNIVSWLTPLSQTARGRTGAASLWLFGQGLKHGLAAALPSGG
jgi:hypothetical protein